jgi:uncharacterized protein YlzI (FlbEa/FlbD family)
MIRVFRHDGLELMLNVDMIKNIQTGPPTVITLLGGEELKVKNSLTDVLEKIRAYRQGSEDENREYDPAEKRNDRHRKAYAPRTFRPAPEAAADADPVSEEPL